MPDEEVKPSWSVGYIMLTIVLSFLTGVVGYSLKYFFEATPKRTITVSKQQTGNLLNLNDQVRKEISSSFTLKSSPAATLESYFQLTVTVTNSGEEAVESLQVVIQATSEKITLLKSPRITSKPPELMTILKTTQIAGVSGMGRDEWEILLLNPGESVIFSYVAYSTEFITESDFTATARARNWSVHYEGEKTETQPRTFLEKPLADLTGLDVVVILSMFTALLVAFQMYFQLILRRLY